MTTQMVRKQIRITKRQDDLVRQLARVKGISQSEFIRQAIERALTGTPAQPLARDPSAMADFKALLESRRSGAQNREPYQWNREEIYAERENRWSKKPESD